MKLPLYRVMLVRESTGRRYRPKITSPAAAYRALRPLFRNLDREHFIVCCLDSKHEIRAINVVSVGTLNLSIVHPREDFKPAILANAHAVIFAHNHPSGVVEPSRADELLTQNLKQALALVDIRVLDHFVVAGVDATSFAERGLL